MPYWQHRKNEGRFTIHLEEGEEEDQRKGWRTTLEHGHVPPATTLIIAEDGLRWREWKDSYR